jgi:aminoglycoside phosphotransferase
VDSFARAEREYACLTHLFGKYPVPKVVEFDASVPVIMLGTVAGRHGQELIAEGHASGVLRLIGEQLAKLQAISSTIIPGLEGEGDVIVHGDFGPQNVVCSFDLTGVAGVLDWESAHVGSPIEDLAWAEWIVRMHHPVAVKDLSHLFEGSGLFIRWSDRLSAMVEQCRRHLAFCEASEWEAPAAEWRRRLAATEMWHE